MNKKALVAIGGNSLLPSGQSAELPQQWDTVRETCRHLADMVQDGWQLVITHGNGPQVGFNLLRSEIAAETIYPLSLDLIVAHTQGSIGYMLQQCLSNELRSRGVRIPVVSVVTQTLVDKDDPAFATPSKPIGRFMGEAEAAERAAEGWTVREDAGRGWRRVVASPEPQAIIEEEAIERLMLSGCIVIAGGGGGIPVVANRKGELRELSGVWGVVDKDRAGGLLARRLGMNLFLISTAVPQVYIHFRTPQQQSLAEVTAAEARRYLAEGHFAKGSMAPKMEAVALFVEQTKGRALITTPNDIGRALHGQTGTWIRPAD
ncbi:MAG: carbamate kinase [Chloroflexi bacterium]|nr:carbamate kinase [Chloroflexota bacterium]